ncbi:MAG TPA: rhodanese-like domain-containing protein [Bacteroidales bacterium]|nr:rhodanese-like domain-containing protein [Bacteroidales bacterium]
MKILISTLLLVISASCIVSQNIININSIELEKTIEELDKQNSVIIDGRSAEKFAENHIIDAINIDAFSEEAQKEILNYLNKHTILLYCTTFNRVELLTEILTNLNYSGTIIVVEDGLAGMMKNIPNSKIFSINLNNQF